MTVKELIRKLEEYDGDAEIYIEPVINTIQCTSVEYDEDENAVYLN